MSQEYTPFPPLPNGLVIDPKLGPLFDRMQMQSYALKMADAATLRQQAARVDAISELIQQCEQHPRGYTLNRHIANVLTAALSAQPAERQGDGEAVAWRYTLASGEWRYATAGDEISIPQPVVEMRPLYLHPAAPVGVPDETFYIDCEFDGHNGPLLSIALVAQDGRSAHIQTDAVARDPWVIANVVPLMSSQHAQVQVMTRINGVGEAIRSFLGSCSAPEIVADSPVDIARFCAALSTDAAGHWASADYPRMTFRVENVDCYPTTLAGAVQHNAWWDAMALRHKLAAAPSAPQGECKCSLRQRLVGDGCQGCNPGLAAELAATTQPEDAE